MIRLKIIAVIITSVLLLAGVIYTISQVVLLKSFEKIETAQMEQNLTRVHSSFDEKLVSLQIKLADWAQWDDTYQFIGDGNTEYIESNLSDETLINLQINLMAFINNNNEVVFSTLVDLAEEVNVPSSSITQQILSYPSLLSPDEEGMQGLISLQEGTMLVVSQPITYSDGSGPKAGTLIFGRFIDDELMEGLEDVTQLSIETFTPDQELPADVGYAQQQLDVTPSVIQKLSKDTLAGYFKLDNIMGEPALIIKIDVPREITAQGEDTIRAFLLISIVSILLLGGTILILLEKLLLRRFAQLSKEMRAISMDNLSFAEVHMGGKDDVGKLAEQINHLFDELAKYKKLEERELQKQQELNQKEKESNESLRKSLEEKAGMNKLMVERELKMIELKKEISRLKEELAQYR